MSYRAAVFHWTFERVGGGEILASYLGKALGCKVYCFGKSKLGFEDLTPYVPSYIRFLKRIRSLEYLLWSSIDLTDLGDFDVIVSSGATPRAIVTPENVMHVNYCHSPPRWLYDLWGFRRKNYKSGKFLALIAEMLRVWDVSVDKRVDYYFVNSEIIKRRLWKYLKRDSVVLYPPVETNKYRNREPEDFILFLSRLEPEKRVELAIRACMRAGKKIVVAGTGTLETRLRKKYPNVEFTGFVDEKTKIDLLSRCKAVVFPAISEDFGIVPIEALASGKPVIVCDGGFPPVLLRKTGLIDKDGVIGVYTGGIVSPAEEQYLARSVELVDRYEWDPEKLMDVARQFDYSVFKSKLHEQIGMWLEEFNTM